MSFFFAHDRNLRWLFGRGNRATMVSSRLVEKRGRVHFETFLVVGASEYLSGRVGVP